MANMVQFRQATAGEAVTNRQNIGGAPGDPIFYLIQALDSTGAVIGGAGRRGEFTFGLAPGQS